MTEENRELTKEEIEALKLLLPEVQRIRKELATIRQSIEELAENQKKSLS